MEWFIPALLVPVFQSLANLLQKVGLKGRSTSVFAFLFTFISFILLSFMLLLPLGITTKLDWRIGAIFINSILGSTGFYYSMKGLKELDLSEAAPIMANLSLIFTGIIEIIIGERFTLLDLVGIGMIIIGSYLLETNFGKRGFQISKGFKYLLINAVVYGICANVDRQIMRTGFPPVLYVFFATMFISINLGLLVWKKRKFMEVKRVWENSFLLVIGISILLVSYRVLQAYAMALAPATLVISIKRLSPLLSVVLGGKVLSEKYIIYRLVASLIMVAGAGIIIIG